MTTYAAYHAHDWKTATWPLGARVVPDRRTTTFAVYSKHATRVVLELFAKPLGEDCVAEFAMAKGNDDVWRAEVSGAGRGTLYGFRCWGPSWPHVPAWRRGGSGAGFEADVDAKGNRFDPNKLLFDPYARELSHETLTPELVAAGLDLGVYATGGAAYRGAPRREFDSGPWAPKGVVVHDATRTGVRPAVPPQDAAIYEAHVRNLTAHPSSSRLRALLAGVPGFERVKDVPPELAGTYRGAALMAPYLRALGFTAIELLPVQEVANGQATRGRTFNHWGYMTEAFFAPDREYASDRSPGGPTREFKEMVRAFHDEGLEVYLDVVLNHTAERGNWDDPARKGEVLPDTVALTSLVGLDTSEYFVLTDRHVLVQGATGCGNQLNCSTVAGQALVLDVLHYWIDEMGVDGFRFDLAPVLGRTPTAYEREQWAYQKRFFKQHPLLLAIRDLGEDRRVEMIAEAWDLWGYEVGNFPSGWGEWNGRFRDAVRGFLKGDGNAPELMAMVNGDYEHYSDQGGAQRSVNFVTCHDGFTLLDLVSYGEKQNGQDPPFGPSDGGSDDNRSWDSGGDHALRRRRMRSFWTVLFFSRGVPLVASGDELARTQNGNNNPWALDDAALWNDYDMAATSSPTAVLPDPSRPAVRYHDNFGRAAGPAGRNPFFRFAAYVANVRARHAALRQRSYGDLVPDNADVSYLFASPDGRGAPVAGDRCVRIHVDASAAGDCDFLVCVNAYVAPIAFTIPPAADGKRWVRIVDTADWAEAEDNCWAPEAAATVAGSYGVGAWSVAVLQEV